MSSIRIERPPLTEDRKEWADWFLKIYAAMSAAQLPVVTDTTRGIAGQMGRIVFNEDDGVINVDDGTQWTLADGTPT